MATIGTRLYTWLNGTKVGQDEFGNTYFQERKADKNQRAKRWVIYNGRNEASKVPAEWHLWLHYTGDAPLTDRTEYKWEKPHVPNLTGTTLAYKPAGHPQKGGKRAAASADYTPWKPNQ